MVGLRLMDSFSGAYASVGDCQLSYIVFSLSLSELSICCSVFDLLFASLFRIDLSYSSSTFSLLSLSLCLSLSSMFLSAVSLHFPFLFILFHSSLFIFSFLFNVHNLHLSFFFYFAQKRKGPTIGGWTSYSLLFIFPLVV